LIIAEAHSLGDFIFLKNLRNNVRHLMTNDTSHIGYWRQLRFYFLRKHNCYRLRSTRIYIARIKRHRVGYVLIKPTLDGARITEAVVPKFRRNGIGQKLIEFAQRGNDNLVAEINQDNRGSIRLHASMGFAPEGTNGSTLIYRYRR